MVNSSIKTYGKGQFLAVWPPCSGPDSQRCARSWRKGTHLTEALRRSLEVTMNGLGKLLSKPNVLRSLAQYQCTSTTPLSKSKKELATSLTQVHCLSSSTQKHNLTTDAGYPVRP